MIKSANTLLF